jgi:glycosyltransferase involved in cell wall biosynthesis
MRICSPQLGVSPISSLGGEVYDREVLKGLANLGVEVEIPLPKGARHDPVMGWHVHQVPRHLRYYYEYNWLFLPRMLRLWRERAFDLLRIHSPTIAPLGWFMRRVTGQSIVAHYHHLEGDRLLDMISRATIRSYSLVTTDSHFCAEQLASAYSLADDRIEVVYPGVDSKYGPRPRSGRLSNACALEGKCVCLYLGVLVPRKNLKFLMDAFALAYQQEDRLVLMLAGTGPQEGELKAYAADRGLQGAVVFTGYVPEAEKVDYYNLADVFVFPSLLEGFGMAVAEAMACGVPVVCSGAASLPEVVGQAGLMASSTQVEEFCEQILRLARDEALRRELGQQGRLRVRSRFSWDEAARRTCACYERVCEAGGGQERVR